MENFVIISLKINTDLFESNIINISLLLVLLYNVVGTALNNNLFQRKEKILEKFTAAEKKINEAEKRLAQKESKLEESEVILRQINTQKQESIKVKINIYKTQVENQLMQDSFLQQVLLDSLEQTLINDVKSSLLTLILTRLQKKVKERLTLQHHVKILENKINLLTDAFIVSEGL